MGDYNWEGLDIEGDYTIYVTIMLQLCYNTVNYCYKLVTFMLQLCKF